jgi:hypothetical protein
MDVSKNDELRKYSDPQKVVAKAKQYLGKNVNIRRSTRRGKKYMIFHNKWIHFGAMGYEDYTKHKNKSRRHNYLTRSAGIHDNGKYSANQLSRHILW